MSGLKPYLECGKIINTHGVKGAVKLESWADSPRDLAGFSRVFFKNGEEYKEIKVLHASVFKQFVIMELEGVGDIDTAMTLRDKIVYAAREDFNLVQGQYFLADVEGVDVIDAREGSRGNKLGILEEILPGAASSIYSVRTENGTVLVPAVPAFIKDVVPGEYILIEPIDGMFDDDTKSEE